MTGKALLGLWLAIGVAMGVATSAAAAERPEPASAAALHRAHARLQLHSGAQPLTVLARLRTQGLASGLLAAELYRRYGLPQAVEAALAGHREQPRAVAIALAAAEARLAMGDAQGVQELLIPPPPADPADAPATLAAAYLWSVGPDADQAQAVARGELLGRAALLADKPNDAVNVLRETDQAFALTPFGRYNLAMAWLRIDAQQKGADMLVDLGSYDGDDPARQALADQANLALGYWLLDMRRPSSARDAFIRVSRGSPVAPKAMLGLGWAQFRMLALPAVITSADPRDCQGYEANRWKDDVARARAPRWECKLRNHDSSRRMLDVLRLRMGNATQRERTLVAWREAASGDILEPAVAEAAAMLGFALAAGGDFVGARDAHQRAIDRLNGGRVRLAEQAVRPTATAGSALALLADDAQRLDAAIGAQRRALARLDAPSPSAQAALARVQPVLAALRAPGGWRSPDPAQRGRLLRALRALDSARTARERFAPRLAGLEQRAARLNARIAGFERGLQARTLAHQRAAQDQLMTLLEAELRQVRLGLAQLLR